MIKQVLYKLTKYQSTYIADGDAPYTIDAIFEIDNLDTSIIKMLVYYCNVIKVLSVEIIEPTLTLVIKNAIENIRN